VKILEFDIPILITPIKPYRINKLNLIILPTDNPAPKNDYWGPLTTTRIILYDVDYKTAKKTLTEFVIFINFLNQNYSTFFWIFDRSFAEWSRYEKTIKNLDQYVKECSKKQDWYMSVDFNQYPLLEITPNPTKINFRYYFTIFNQLSSDIKSESKLKTLISFFAYNYITGMIMSKIYDNSNLQISNSFILLETLVKSEIKNQKDFKLCPNCGAMIPDKKNIMNLIEEFLKKRTKDQVILKRVISILKKHYTARNTFIHNAKFETTFEKEERMIKKLGRTNFTLDDEIEHAGAARSGLYVINSIIRHELLKKLKIKSST
jgi:hypothetical protein